MKQAILKYVSPWQTQNHPLRELLAKCEPHGLAVERDPIGGRAYRIVNGEDVLTEFVTLAKLYIWMCGFEASIELKNKRNESNENENDA